jgi:hypothetical protein
VKLATPTVVGFSLRRPPDEVMVVGGAAVARAADSFVEVRAVAVGVRDDALSTSAIISSRRMADRTVDPQGETDRDVPAAVRRRET